jgi:hypothetical protein
MRPVRLRGFRQAWDNPVLNIRLDARRYISALICGGAWLANATPVGLLDIPQLVATSDAIAVGEIASVEGTGRGTVTVGEQALAANEFKAELSVSRIIKGPADSRRIEFTFYLPDEPVAFQNIAPGDAGTFFLHEILGHYFISDPHYPRIAAVKQCASSEPLPVLDSVTVELTYAVAAPSAPETTQLAAIDALDSIPTGRATDALKLAALSPTTPVRLRAIAALLGRNEVSQLASVQDLLLQPVADPLRGAVDRLASAIWHGVRNPEAIGVLERLLRAPDFKVRRGAAQALRNTGSSRAIGGLAEALNDSERDIRYIAVIGLGEITRQNEWSPSIDNFSEHEAYFLSYWRNWLNNRH